MKISVMSRNEAKAYSYKEDNEPYVIISITDIDTPIALFNKNESLKSVLRLKFEDLEKEVPEAMTMQDAEKIVGFVDFWKDRISHIVVHCEYGISRSAGVAAALSLWLNEDDSEIFNNWDYEPNLRCYRFVLSGIFKRIREKSDV